jgi:hypothetical protein
MCRAVSSVFSKPRACETPSDRGAPIRRLHSSTAAIRHQSRDFVSVLGTATIVIPLARKGERIAVTVKYLPRSVLIDQNPFLRRHFSIPREVWMDSNRSLFKGNANCGSPKCKAIPLPAMYRQLCLGFEPSA